MRMTEDVMKKFNSSNQYTFTAISNFLLVFVNVYDYLPRTTTTIILKIANTVIIDLI